MDKILINEIRVFGYHGALEEERMLGQEFIIDVELFLDLKKAASEDNLLYSVDYSEVYKIVYDISTNKKFKLIESLATNILCEILNKYSVVQKVKIKVKKPHAPVNGIVGFFAVEIERDRNG